MVGNRKRENANIKQVAAEANVSVGLVSRYINGKPGVGKDSSVRIAAAVKKLNYRGNDIARALVQKKTDTIAVVLDTLSQPFVFDMIRGLEEAGRETGYKIIYGDSLYDTKYKLESIEYFSHRVDGLIFFCSLEADNAIVESLYTSGFPFVMIENDVTDLRVNKVLIDNFDCGRQIVKYFFDKGHRDIRAVMWGMDTRSGQQRYSGFQAGMAECGLELKPEKYFLLNNTANIKEGYQVMQSLIEANDLPDAIFFGVDLLVFGALLAGRDYGIKYPGDIDLAGFDNDFYLDRDYLMPRFPTFKQPLYEMGYKACQMLAETLNNPNQLPYTVIYNALLVNG